MLLALVLFLIGRVYLTRHTSEPPKWMSKLQMATPKFAFLLGLALMGVFPTDIASSTAAGLHVARHGDPWWQVLPFVCLTLLFLASRHSRSWCSADEPPLSCRRSATG